MSQRSLEDYQLEAGHSVTSLGADRRRQGAFTPLDTAKLGRTAYNVMESTQTTPKGIPSKEPTYETDTEGPFSVKEKESRRERGEKDTDEQRYTGVIVDKDDIDRTPRSLGRHAPSSMQREEDIRARSRETDATPDRSLPDHDQRSEESIDRHDLPPGLRSTAYDIPRALHSYMLPTTRVIPEKYKPLLEHMGVLRSTLLESTTIFTDDSRPSLPRSTSGQYGRLPPLDGNVGASQTTAYDSQRPVTESTPPTGTQTNPEEQRNTTLALYESGIHFPSLHEAMRSRQYSRKSELLIRATPQLLQMSQLLLSAAEQLANAAREQHYYAPRTGTRPGQNVDVGILPEGFSRDLVGGGLGAIPSKELQQDVVDNKDALSLEHETTTVRPERLSATSRVTPRSRVPYYTYETSLDIESPLDGYRVQSQAFFPFLQRRYQEHIGMGDTNKDGITISQVEDSVTIQPFPALDIHAGQQALQASGQPSEEALAEAEASTLALAEALSIEEAPSSVEITDIAVTDTVQLPSTTPSGSLGKRLNIELPYTTHPPWYQTTHGEFFEIDGLDSIENTTDSPHLFSRVFLPDEIQRALHPAHKDIDTNASPTMRQEAGLRSIGKDTQRDSAKDAPVVTQGFPDVRQTPVEGHDYDSETDDEVVISSMPWGSFVSSPHVTTDKTVTSAPRVTSHFHRLQEDFNKAGGAPFYRVHEMQPSPYWGEETGARAPVVSPVRRDRIPLTPEEVPREQVEIPIDLGEEEEDILGYRMRRRKAAVPSQMMPMFDDPSSMDWPTELMVQSVSESLSPSISDEYHGIVGPGKPPGKTRFKTPSLDDIPSDLYQVEDKRIDSLPGPTKADTSNEAGSYTVGDFVEAMRTKAQLETNLLHSMKMRSKQRRMLQSMLGDRGSRTLPEPEISVYMDDVPKTSRQSLSHDNWNLRQGDPSTDYNIPRECQEEEFIACTESLPKSGEPKIERNFYPRQRWAPDEPSPRANDQYLAFGRKLHDAEPYTPPPSKTSRFDIPPVPRTPVKEKAFGPYSYQRNILAESSRDKGLDTLLSRNQLQDRKQDVWKKIYGLRAKSPSQALRDSFKDKKHKEGAAGRVISVLPLDGGHGAKRKLSTMKGGPPRIWLHEMGRIEPETHYMNIAYDLLHANKDTVGNRVVIPTWLQTWPGQASSISSAEGISTVPRTDVHQGIPTDDNTWYSDTLMYGEAKKEAEDYDGTKPEVSRAARKHKPPYRRGTLRPVPPPRRQEPGEEEDEESTIRSDEPVEHGLLFSLGSRDARLQSNSSSKSNLPNRPPQPHTTPRSMQSVSSRAIQRQRGTRKMNDRSEIQREGQSPSVSARRIREISPVWPWGIVTETEGKQDLRDKHRTPAMGFGDSYRLPSSITGAVETGCDADDESEGTMESLRNELLHSGDMGSLPGGQGRLDEWEWINATDFWSAGDIQASPAPDLITEARGGLGPSQLNGSVRNLVTRRSIDDKQSPITKDKLRRLSFSSPGSIYNVQRQTPIQDRDRSRAKTSQVSPDERRLRRSAYLPDIGEDEEDQSPAWSDLIGRWKTAGGPGLKDSNVASDSDANWTSIKNIGQGTTPTSSPIHLSTSVETGDQWQGSSMLFPDNHTTNTPSLGLHLHVLQPAMGDIPSQETSSSTSSPGDDSQAFPADSSKRIIRSIAQVIQTPPIKGIAASEGPKVEDMGHCIIDMHAHSVDATNKDDSDYALGYLHKSKKEDRDIGPQAIWRSLWNAATVSGEKESPVTKLLSTDTPFGSTTTRKRPYLPKRRSKGNVKHLHKTPRIFHSKKAKKDAKHRPDGAVKVVSATTSSPAVVPATTHAKNAKPWNLDARDTQASRPSETKRSTALHLGNERRGRGRTRSLQAKRQLSRNLKHRLRDFASSPLTAYLSIAVPPLYRTMLVSHRHQRHSCRPIQVLNLTLEATRGFRPIKTHRHTEKDIIDTVFSLDDLDSAAPTPTSAYIHKPRSTRGKSIRQPLDVQRFYGRYLCYTSESSGYIPEDVSESTFSEPLTSGEVERAPLPDTSDVEAQHFLYGEMSPGVTTHNAWTQRQEDEFPPRPGTRPTTSHRELEEYYFRAPIGMLSETHPSEAVAWGDVTASVEDVESEPHTNPGLDKERMPPRPIFALHTEPTQTPLSSLLSESEEPLVEPVRDVTPRAPGAAVSDVWRTFSPLSTQTFLSTDQILHPRYLSSLHIPRNTPTQTSGTTTYEDMDRRFIDSRSSGGYLSTPEGDDFGGSDISGLSFTESGLQVPFSIAATVPLLSSPFSNRRRRTEGEETSPGIEDIRTRAESMEPLVVSKDEGLQSIGQRGRSTQQTEGESSPVEDEAPSANRVDDQRMPKQPIRTYVQKFQSQFKDYEHSPSSHLDSPLSQLSTFSTQTQIGTPLMEPLESPVVETAQVDYNAPYPDYRKPGEHAHEEKLSERVLNNLRKSKHRPERLHDQDQGWEDYYSQFSFPRVYKEDLTSGGVSEREWSLLDGLHPSPRYIKMDDAPGSEGRKRGTRRIDRLLQKGLFSPPFRSASRDTLPIIERKQDNAPTVLSRNVPINLLSKSSGTTEAPRVDALSKRQSHYRSISADADSFVSTLKNACALPERPVPVSDSKYKMLDNAEIPDYRLFEYFPYTSRVLHLSKQFFSFEPKRDIEPLPELPEEFMYLSPVHTPTSQRSAGGDVETKAASTQTHESGLTRELEIGETERRHTLLVPLPSISFEIGLVLRSTGQTRDIRVDSVSLVANGAANRDSEKVSLTPLLRLPQSRMGDTDAQDKVVMGEVHMGEQRDVQTYPFQRDVDRESIQVRNLDREKSTASRSVSQKLVSREDQSATDKDIRETSLPWVNRQRTFVGDFTPHLTRPDSKSTAADAGTTRTSTLTREPSSVDAHPPTHQTYAPMDVISTESPLIAKSATSPHKTTSAPQPPTDQRKTEVRTPEEAQRTTDQRSDDIGGPSDQISNAYSRENVHTIQRLPWQSIPPEEAKSQRKRPPRLQSGLSASLAFDLDTQRSDTSEGVSSSWSQSPRATLIRTNQARNTSDRLQKRQFHRWPSVVKGRTIYLPDDFPFGKHSSKIPGRIRKPRSIRRRRLPSMWIKNIPTRRTGPMEEESKGEHMGDLPGTQHPEQTTHGKEQQHKGLGSAEQTSTNSPGFLPQEGSIQHPKASVPDYMTLQQTGAPSKEEEPSAYTRPVPVPAARSQRQPLFALSQRTPCPPSPLIYQVQDIGSSSIEPVSLSNNRKDPEQPLRSLPSTSREVISAGAKPFSSSPSSAMSGTPTKLIFSPSNRGQGSQAIQEQGQRLDELETASTNNTGHKTSPYLSSTRPSLTFLDAEPRIPRSPSWLSTSLGTQPQITPPISSSSLPSKSAFYDPNVRLTNIPAMEDDRIQNVGKASLIPHSYYSYKRKID